MVTRDKILFNLTTTFDAAYSKIENNNVIEDKLPSAYIIDIVDVLIYKSLISQKLKISSALMEKVTKDKFREKVSNDIDLDKAFRRSHFEPYVSEALNNPDEAEELTIRLYGGVENYLDTFKFNRFIKDLYSETESHIKSISDDLL